jgi:hypothetical protein
VARRLCQGVLSFQNIMQFHGTRTNVFCTDAHEERAAFHFTKLANNQQQFVPIACSEIQSKSDNKYEKLRVSY